MAPSDTWTCSTSNQNLTRRVVLAVLVQVLLRMVETDAGFLAEEGILG